MPKKTTRIESDQPRAVSHLSTEQQTALEISGEVDHAQGRPKETLTRKSKELSEKRKAAPNRG
jgi:hypothetical protein